MLSVGAFLQIKGAMHQDTRTEHDRCIYGERRSVMLHSLIPFSSFDQAKKSTSLKLLSLPSDLQTSSSDSKKAEAKSRVNIRRSCVNRINLCAAHCVLH